MVLSPDLGRTKRPGPSASSSPGMQLGPGRDQSGMQVGSAARMQFVQPGVPAAMGAGSQTHTDTPEYYSTVKKKKTLPFTTTWMDLQGIMLSEISQTEKDKYCIFLLVCGF